MMNLGINRLEKEDEIQRYQFLRLIGGAKEAHLFYSEGVNKEKSRFLEELIWERQKGQQALEVMRAPRVAFTVSMQPGKEPARKTAQMMEFLRKKTYSASSVNTYLHCPMRFYYHYVLGLKEKTDLLDETEAADIGTFVHELLQEAYAGFKGAKPLIDRAFRARFMSLFETRFEAVFEKKMRSDAFMLKEILRLRLENFLDKESLRDVAQIVCLEDEERATLETGTGSFGFTYRIDRVDRLSDGSLLVIDYKTGGTDLKPSSYTRIKEQGFERRTMKKSVKSFQLPLYLYFIDRQFPESRANAAFYNLRSASLASFLKQEEMSKKKEILDVFLTGLGSLFTELLDPSADFQVDEDNPF
jgi:ATP-dependent helicase/DNAse subunit B